MSFYVLTVFFMLGGEPYAETRITESHKACQIAGMQTMQALMLQETIEAPQFICNRARVQEREA